MTPDPGSVVRLAWVLDGALLRHVSAFAHLAPNARPSVTCPVCSDRVTLKLGDVKAYHAAHRDDSTCPAQTWETALHLNTKHHIAAALRAASPDGTLTVRHRCSRRAGVLGETVAVPGLVPCTAVRDVALADGWDAVEVEAGLATTRPDILLLRNGRPIGLIEVRHTHAVTARKIEDLATLGVPWAEVVASRGLYAELSAWMASEPLTVLRTDACAQWWCDAHRPRVRRRGVTHDVVDLRNGAWAARVVDRYLPDARWLREIFYVTGTRHGRSVRDPIVWRRGDASSLAALPNGPADVVLAAAHDVFVAWAQSQRAGGERIDSPMSWAAAASLQDGERGWVAGTSLYPPRLRFDRDALCWTPRPGVGETPWALAKPLDLPGPRG